MSRIDFVAVPQPSGLISILVVPRLDGATIADMADWSATLADASLELVGDPGGAVAVRVANAPDPALWRRVFPAATELDEAGAPADPGDVRIEETAAHAERIAATYEASAVAFADADGEAVVRTELAGWDEPEPEPAPPVGEGTWVRPGFHRTISLLREHPAVLRALGLVFDVRPPDGFWRDAGRVRVRWPQHPLVVSPWTAYERTDRGYVPAGAGEIVGGMLDVGGPSWSVSGMDVTGGVGRLRDAARAAAATLPPLRSQGLSLIRRGRGEDVAARRAERARDVPLAERTLTANDLVLGYRVDVRREGGGSWQTLTSRLAQYTVNGVALDSAPRLEHAHVKAAAFGRDDAGVLRGDEIVTRWDGWSLVVPRPTTGRREAPARRQDLLVDLDATFAVEPGSLPVLRFGEKYRLRIRIADPTGGGVELDAPEADVAATPFFIYGRLEPVAPPAVVAAEESSDELMEEIVVRSDRGLDVAAFSAVHPEYPTAIERRLRAPRVPLRIADEHGALDAAGDEVIRAAAVEAAITDPAAGGVALTVRDEPGALSPGASIDEDWSGSWPALTDKTLRVSAPEPGRPRLEWRDHVAVVRPTPGERVTLDISSLIADGMAEKLEIAQWLRGRDGSSITAGRHPMVTPARGVRVIHAVRKPVSDPAGTLEPLRDPDSTASQLVPSTPLLGLHPGSTAQLDLTASWNEWSDGPEPTPATATLPPSVLPLGADRLPEIRHEFADTKHRRIGYRASAVSRFREYFDAADPEDAFRADIELAEVWVPSSSIPPRPVVLSVSPGFRWSGTELPAGWTKVVRTRHGGLLRVELARPWYVSGEAERLAVLVWDAPGLPSATEPVTRIGRDPIRDTPPLVILPPLSAFDGAVDATFHRDNVTAVPYATWFADDRWWADIPVPGIADASYGPFIQLAVARYQAESIADHHLSEPVLTEPTTVLPDRRLTVERDGSSVTVVLEGSAATTPSHTVRVEVQSTDGSADSEAVDPTPLDVGGVIGMPPAEEDVIAAPGARGVWRPYSSGVSTLGQPLRLEIRPVAGRFRVVVRETEDIPGDQATAELPPELVARTVFLDIVPL